MHRQHYQHRVVRSHIDRDANQRQRHQISAAFQVGESTCGARTCPERRRRYSCPRKLVARLWTRLRALTSGVEIRFWVAQRPSSALRAGFSALRQGRNRRVPTGISNFPEADLPLAISRGDPDGAAPHTLSHTCAKPPSTNTSLPVIKLLSSEARNKATAAVSSGLPTRSSGA